MLTSNKEANVYTELFFYQWLIKRASKIFITCTASFIHTHHYNWEHKLMAKVMFVKSDSDVILL